MKYLLKKKYPLQKHSRKVSKKKREKRLRDLGGHVNTNHTKTRRESIVERLFITLRKTC